MIRGGIICIISLIYLLAAIEKLLNVELLKQSLAASQLVPHQFIGAASAAVLVMEVLIPLLLICRPSRKFGLLLVCLSSLGFWWFHTLMSARGSVHLCACFGGFVLPNWAYFALNAFLFVSGVLLLRQNLKMESGPSPLD